MVDFCKVKIVTDVEKLNIFNISFREVNKLAWSIFKHPETNSEHCIKFYVLVSCWKSVWLYCRSEFTSDFGNVSFIVHTKKTFFFSHAVLKNNSDIFM